GLIERRLIEWVGSARRPAEHDEFFKSLDCGVALLVGDVAPGKRGVNANGVRLCLERRLQKIDGGSAVAQSLLRHAERKKRIEVSRTQSVGLLKAGERALEIAFLVGEHPAAIQ